jgi:hypothetical protein
LHRNAQARRYARRQALYSSKFQRLGFFRLSLFRGGIYNIVIMMQVSIITFRPYDNTHIYVVLN